MNKSALRNFAISARNELIKKVEARALKIGITEESIKKAQFESSDAIYIDGKQLSVTEKKQRDKLIQRVREIGYKNVIEEVAYTWFNRFIALRFMEVNNYLPTKVRVLSSSESGNPEPDILKEALSVELDVDKEFVYDLKLNNKTDELFKYMIIKQCNDLNKYLPFMFETIEDYKEILFPEGLLAKESFLRHMTDVTTISESDWEQVETIGWLYQYYIAEKKDEVFADLKKNIKISKENIPAATQLFTPHWIVRYMVENSLGRMWLENYPESPLKSEWKYFLDEAEQEQQVKDELEKIRRTSIDPESITFLDPCCGSGHILVYAFDVFYAMYLEKGYIPHEIPKLILEKNLFGLDIDDRAAQLASFAVMMKAREKSRRVLSQGIKPNICSIQDSEWMTQDVIDILVGTNRQDEPEKLQEIVLSLKKAFKHSKEFGSMIQVETLNIELLEKRLRELSEEPTDLIDMITRQTIREKLPDLLMQWKLISSRYDIVCTNPPYMGNSNMESHLKDFLQSNFTKSKGDLCTAYIEVGLSRTKTHGYCSLVTMHSWFFITSFEALRNSVLSTSTITSIVHLGMEAFDGIIGKVVQTAAFVLKNTHISEYKPVAIRLVDFYDSRRHEKETQFFEEKNIYKSCKQSDFFKIPGSPFAYWASENTFNIFKRSQKIREVGFSKKGLDTGDNSTYLRMWFEIDYTKKNIKWFPLNKGGAFRKWYGNQLYLIDWENDGYRLKAQPRANIRNESFYFREGLTWSELTSGDFGARYSPEGFIFEATGPCYFGNNTLEMLAYMNSKVFNYLAKFTMSTIHYTNGSVADMPYVDVRIDKNRVEEMISISKVDWDSMEISWGFKKHPLVDASFPTIRSSFATWKEFTESQFSLLKMNEEEVNRLFIETYGMQDELTPDVAEKNVSVRKADLVSDIKSFISYAIGCCFGRYSLDEEGLIYAGGKFDISRYKTFVADEDNIIPVLSGVYFEDDVVSRFVDFVRVVFGLDTLEENLEFIADALGKRDSETSREAIRRYFLNDFFKDHVQTYKKKPIYWLFTSGKQKAFNCLIYMHRYDKATLSRIRTDYVHELQIRFDSEKKSLLNVIEGDGTAREISAAKKELKTLDLKIAELKQFEELLHHIADQQIEIDLDDGVDVNYSKFEALLAKRG